LNNCNSQLAGFPASTLVSLLEKSWFEVATPRGNIIKTTICVPVVYENAGPELP
jgi:hypothetical protein